VDFIPFGYSFFYLAPTLERHAFDMISLNSPTFLSSNWDFRGCNISIDSSAGDPIFFRHSVGPTPLFRQGLLVPMEESTR